MVLHLLCLLFNFTHVLEYVYTSDEEHSRARDHVVRLDLSSSVSAHICGCVVDGGNAMAAI